MPSNFDPDIIAAAGGDDAERLARGKRGRSEIVLDGAELVERPPGIGGQELVQHAFHRIKRQGARCEF
jgi:hypothetical protein